MSFDKHWNEWAISTNTTEDEVLIHYEAGAASRQAEIDELQSKLETAENNLNNAFKTIKFEQQYQDELQKRIDDALNFYNIAKSDANIGMMQMAIYLKGESR